MTTQPRHIAIIMDGNGRWAKQRNLPRMAGHVAGVESVRKIVKVCSQKNIEALTLFAFSSENWRRPSDEVQHIFSLFLDALSKEITELHGNKVQFRVIGDRSPFNSQLLASIDNAEQLTKHNTGLKLVIAANYGGRWDITQACKNIASAVQQGQLDLQAIDEALIQSHLALSDISEPDLFIRTSGEQRISNYLIWQLSYTELYFPACHWPDFDEAAFEAALAHYSGRQRRFGYTGEQLENQDFA